MVNLVKFRINTSFDGVATYLIYEGSTCDDGGVFVTSGTTEVVDGISDVIIYDVDLVDNMSIKVIDSNLCESCQSFNVTFANCTPFSGTAQYIEPIPVDNPDIFYSYSSNNFGYGQLKFDYINISNQNSEIIINHLDQANPESTTSNFIAKANTFIEINLRNDSSIVSETSLLIQINGVTVYNSGATTMLALQETIEVNDGDSIAVNAITNGNNPIGD